MTKDPKPMITEDANIRAKNYNNDFFEAIKFSSALGLSVPNQSPYGNFSLEEIEDLLARLNIQTNGFDCLEIVLNELPQIRSLTEKPVWPTFGHIKLSGGNVCYHFTREDVAHWVKNGYNKESIDLHAWWTLAGGLIIDPTIYSSMAKVDKSHSSLAGTILVGYPRNIEAIIYHPIVISDHFDFEIKVVRGIRFT